MGKDFFPVGGGGKQVMPELTEGPPGFPKVSDVPVPEGRTVGIRIPWEDSRALLPPLTPSGPDSLIC